MSADVYHLPRWFACRSSGRFSRRTRSTKSCWLFSRLTSISLFDVWFILTDCLLDKMCDLMPNSFVFICVETLKETELQGAWYKSMAHPLSSVGAVQRTIIKVRYCFYTRTHGQGHRSKHATATHHNTWPRSYVIQGDRRKQGHKSKQGHGSKHASITHHNTWPGS